MFDTDTPIGDQHVIPGTERDPAGLARKLAAEPLKPDRPQEACDHGLFGEGWKQTDLVDLLKGGGNAKSQSSGQDAKRNSSSPALAVIHSLPAKLRDGALRSVSPL